MKKISLLYTLCIISVLFSSAIEARPSEEAVNKAFNEYISTRLLPSNFYNPFVKRYDINGDGVQECFFMFEQGPRYGVRILTYKSGNVYNALSDTRALSCIYYKRSAKKIAISFSSGASHNSLVVYKLKGKKLKKIVEYKEEGDYYTQRYYKNNTRVTKQVYENAIKPYLYWNRL